MRKVEKSRSNLEIVYSILDDEDKEVDTEIWYLRQPTLPPVRRDFTLEEALFFNNMTEDRPSEAEVVNESFRKMKVLPFFAMGALVIAGSYFVDRIIALVL